MSKKFAAAAALIGVLFGMIMAVAPSASAACSSSPAVGIHLYSLDGCTGTHINIGEGFSWVNNMTLDSKTSAIGNDNLSSLNMSPVTAAGSLRIRIYDANGRHAADRVISLTNASSTAKNWDLADYNLNNVARSLCWDRVSGSWDPAFCDVS